ncbi:MAG: NUDIX hydrolase, partial [Oscillospiraceae bacterium]|nr:NUDIX hydrolase [Candidatus Equicaccousia limihippi]
MNLKEITQKTEYIYKGRIINLRKDDVLLPNGNLADREIIEHPGGASILAVTDEGEVLFVEQYRHPTGDILTEIPAGKLEKGEKPEVCAAREIVEETGYKASKLELLMSCWPSPGCYGEKLHLFLAKGLTFVGEN